MLLVDSFSLELPGEVPIVPQSVGDGGLIGEGDSALR